MILRMLCPYVKLQRRRGRTGSRWALPRISTLYSYCFALLIVFTPSDSCWWVKITTSYLRYVRRADCCVLLSAYHISRLFSLIGL